MRFRGDIVRRNSSSSFSNNSIVGDAGGKQGKKESSKFTPRPDTMISIKQNLCSFLKFNITNRKTSESHAKLDG